MTLTTRPVQTTQSGPPVTDKRSGRTPNRPVNSGVFGKRLKHSGLTIRGGRNTGFIALAAELPAAVLADLLAIDVVTATRWAGYAKRDWNDYLAIRHANPNPRDTAAP